MSIAALIRRMAELGTPAEAIAIAVEAIEAEQAKDAARRAKRAEQKASERAAKRDVARLSRDCRATVCDPSPEVSLPPAPPSLPDPPTKKTPKGVQKGSPSEILGRVLRPEVAAAVIDHRRKLRKPLTDLAAERLASQFAKMADPNDAAGMMVERGWQAFDPEWAPSKPQATKTGAADPQFVWVPKGTEAWAAWAKHRGKEPVPSWRDGDPGQWMPTEFPPQETAA